ALDSAARRGLIDSAESALDRLATTTDYADFGDAELVVEAVFENLAVKRDVFARLSGAAPRDAVLATNTSYLDPRDIATAVDDPSRFIGIHFFSPAQIMKLVEIVPVPQTSAATRATAFRLVGRMGKVGIGAGICEGFIGNRILKRYRAAAETLLREGVPISDVDAAMRGFGMAMGPFEAQDLGGLDIAFQQREAAREAGGDVSGTLGDILVRAGRMGQKSGGGWYDYAEGDRTPRTSAETEDLLRGHIDAAAPRDADAIAARLVAEMAEEGAAIVAEGIAADPGQVDLVEIHGYGFPRWRGGPMFHAARMGLGALEVALGRAPSEALSKLGMG
ncbi:MAG: 3-hydroxyacyl-CoA dehydrogenase family protein, partial [Paracoccaceae bacterium]